MKISNIFKPHKIIYHLNFTPFKYFIPDKMFVKAQFKNYLKKDLNLKKPETFTEKLQWMKLYDRNPDYTDFVDKYKMKKIIAEKIGEQYVVPVLGVWDNPSDVDFDLLPERFVLKTNHDSKGVCICRDKENFDKEAAIKKLEFCIKRNFYYEGREWPYKNVKRCVFAEEYLENGSKGELKDYKIFCFNGEPKIMYIVPERTPGKETYADFFDMEFNHLDLRMDHDYSPVPIEKPKNFELMKELAKKLSDGIPQVRVDFYEVEGQVYFGEMTFFHSSGTAPVRPESWNKKLGSWINLPEKR